MKVQIVRARVPDERRERYLRAWSEWSGTLYRMGIRAELLESAERAGEFVEITRFAPGEEPALGDDRIVAINAELNAAAERREGDLHLYEPRGGEKKD